MLLASVLWLGSSHVLTVCVRHERALIILI